MSGDHLDVSSVILLQIINRLDNIKAKIESELFHLSADNMLDRVENEQLQISAVSLITVLKKIETIEECFNTKIASLPVEDAIDSFRAYQAGKKKPKGYYYVMDLFLEQFRGRNIATVSGEEMEEFFYGRWEDSKPNTRRVRHAQLNGLFEHAILMCKKKGMPVFYNPMQFIESPTGEAQPSVFYPAEFIRNMLSLTKQEHEWLSIAIITTAGLRANEYLGLTPDDVNGQILTLRDPKSGNNEEYAVIPELIARKLATYIRLNLIKPGQRISPVGYEAVLRLVGRLSEAAGERITTYKLRKWCARYWYEKADEGMVKFVLRYSPARNGEHFDPLMKEMLEAKSVAACTIEESCEKVKAFEEDLLLHSDKLRN